MWKSFFASQALRDRVHEVQAGHVLVRDLGVHAGPSPVVEGLDEARSAPVVGM